MTVRINKQKINLREKLAGAEDKVNFDEVVRGLGEYGGNVGIGTASPDSKLTIGGVNSPAIKLISAYNNELADAAITVNEAGSVTIDADQSNNSSTYDTNFRVRVDGNEHMRINSAGNVGIGTTGPGPYKLNVNGAARVVHSSSESQEVTSDDRVKHNEQPIVGALETLSKITPKKYIKTTEMYDVDHDFELDADGNPIDENGEPVEHRVEAGVIAQQVLTVDELAFAVSPEGVDQDGTVTSPHGLDYNSLFTYAIAAIQEQQTIINDLKSRIETLEQQ